MFNTPILFLIFNRPDQTKEVFKQIRSIRPKKLFIAADGPRSTHTDDVDKCNLARRIVTGGIDWDCEIKTLFRRQNLGCGHAISEGINWFFDQVEEGIILEDDCFPDLSFFAYCEELLHKYKNVSSVMHISGDNFQDGKWRGKGSYYFSAYSHCWGWASWQRSWKNYDFLMDDLNLEKLSITLKKYNFEKVEIEYWCSIFQKVAIEKVIDTWDYQWMYAILKNKGVCILPNQNLVKNLGFNSDATHTKKAKEKLKNQQLSSLNKIEHPDKIEIDIRADRYSFMNHFFNQPSKFAKIKNKLIKILSRFYSLFRKFRFKKIYKKYRSFTMIPEKNYLSNLELCWQFRHIKGCVVECGTWRGGMIAGIVDILGADREYSLFDSFEGLPEVKAIDGAQAKAWQENKNGDYYYNNCLAHESEAKEAMTKTKTLNYKIHKGWFNATLVDFKTPEGIAILRLDADWYDSTMECLTHLFPQLNKGGLILIDDYYTWEGCSKAVHDYLSQQKSACRISSYNGICYIQKL